MIIICVRDLHIYKNDNYLIYIYSCYNVYIDFNLIIITIYMALPDYQVILAYV